MCHTTNSPAENILASTQDLFAVLTQFGMTYPRRSSQRRFGVKLQLHGQDKVLQRVGSLVLMTVDEE